MRIFVRLYDHCFDDDAFVASCYFNLDVDNLSNKEIQKCFEEKLTEYNWEEDTTFFNAITIFKDAGIILSSKLNLKIGIGTNVKEINFAENHEEALKLINKNYLEQNNDISKKDSLIIFYSNVYLKADRYLKFCSEPTELV